MTPSQEDILYLDSNENLQISKTFLKSILESAIDSTDPRMYPEGQYDRLTHSLAEYLNIQEDEVVIGTGADGIIDLFARSMMTSNDSALIIEPTFTMYRKVLSVYHRKIREVLLKEEFKLDVEGVKEELLGRNEVLFICSPNNPTGNQFDRDEVRALLESTKGLILLDEVYVEFARETLIDLVKNYDNLFVLRTFSKAFGLAGLRLGYAVTNDILAKTVREQVSLPYPVSTLASSTASILLENMSQVEEAIIKVKQMRTMLYNELQKFPRVRVYPSQANFILFEVPQSSDSIAKQMLELGVKVRVIEWIKNDGNYIRVSVPPVSELKRVVNVFKEVLK
ncbi:MAG: histidinol-phosphate transaminase [Candidatus Thorarchaeota archaeon]